MTAAPAAGRGLVQHARVLGFCWGAVSIDGLHLAPFDSASCGTLPALLARVAPLFTREREGVVLLDEQHAAALGLGDAPPRTLKASTDHPAVVAARAAGWSVSRLAPWSTFWANGRPSVHLCVVPWLDAEHAGPLFGVPGHGDPLEAAWHLSRFHALTGGSWHGTGGTTGVGLLRDKHRPAKAPYWCPAGVRKWGPLTQNAEHDVINWSREPGAGIAREAWPDRAAEPDAAALHEHGPHEHRYDLNLAYLGAAAMVTVAADDLTRNAGRTTFDPKRAGYWRIERPVWNEPRICNPLGYRNDDPAQRGIWVTTPTMVLLHQLAADGLGAAPVVLDSWTAPAVRVLRPWADRIHAAIMAARDTLGEDADPAQLAALKLTYTQAVGMFGHDASRVYRPDWRHAVMALARSNLWRKVHRVGLAENRWPSWMNRDAVAYRSSDPDPVAGCPSGIPLNPTALGALHIEQP